MAKDMTLLWASGSHACWRIMLALEEKNLQGYNQKQLYFEKGEHKSKEVMEINPRGQLPAFKCGDVPLNESCAACFHLECKYKTQGTKLIPDCEVGRAQILQRVFEVNALVEKSSSVIYYNLRVPEGERHDSAIKRNKEALTAELKLWEGYLQASSGFIVGKDFTLADVVVYPNVAYLFHYGLSEQRYPKLAEYYKGLMNRPSIKASWPPTWKNAPKQETLKDI
ncbi:glutathione S-transferase A-like [Astatotilapia calliptera]|uniref:Glutathione S-transferase rho n=1 Tax=Astatotilapia calliptera TaxID=8154 RepID=A0A3P8NKU6_ASTCA|nr:glutathione S-transferase A-like [Astatotilapia calliptera]